MDRGPFRAAGRPADRKVAPTYRQPEPTQTVSEEPAKSVHRAPAASHSHVRESKPKKRFIMPLLGIIVLALVAAAGWFAWSNMQNTATAIDTSKYQAVFFTNGQVYFGKLKSFNKDYLKLTGIFYLQTQSSGEAASDNPQKTTTEQTSNVQLIKLGEEVHGPQDEMVISRSQVLFYENLKSDGKVALGIDKYNNGSKK